MSNDGGSKSRWLRQGGKPHLLVNVPYGVQYLEFVDVPGAIFVEPGPDWPDLYDLCILSTCQLSFLALAPRSY